MKIPRNQVTKLDDRSKQVVNLGKEPGTKAYRLLDPKTNRIFVSRDVVFEETKAWPKWESNEETAIQNSDFEISGGEETDAENQMKTVGESDSDEQTQGTETPVVTPECLSSHSRLNVADYDDSVEPRRIRNLADVYDNSEQVELDEELYLMGVEEPTNYKQTVKEN